MVIPWEPLRDVLMSNRRFVLSSHVRPDADAVGSELGLAAILRSLGKEVRIVNPSAVPATLKFLDPENQVLKIGDDIKAEALLETDVHIVVDTSSWSQLQDVGQIMRRGTAKHYQIKQGVRAQPIGTVHRHAGSLPHRHQTWNHSVGVVPRRS